MVKRRTVLSDADREGLRRAIKDGEANSSAELVLVIADSCGGYSLFALLWPALAALLVGGILALALPRLAAARLFLVEAGVFTLLAAGLQWPRALLRVVPLRVRRAHAQQIAEHQFALRVQGRTPARTGVLMMVALAERQVFILPDTGIADFVDEAAWRGVVDRLVAAIAAGPALEAIGGAVKETLTLLEQYFPAVIGGGNALPDEVIESDGAGGI